MTNEIPSTQLNVVKLDPTINTIRQEEAYRDMMAREEQARREEEARIREKREMLAGVLNMQADLEKHYKAVKAQKKAIKSLLLDLEDVADDTTLTAEDIRDLFDRGLNAIRFENFIETGIPHDEIGKFVASLLGIDPNQVVLRKIG